MRTRMEFVGILLLAAELLLPALASAEQAKPTWALGVGGSVATRYTYRTVHSTFVQKADAEYIFGNTWMASISLNRKLKGTLSLQTGVDYFQQEDPGFMQTAHIACWTFGVRASSERMEGAHPYIEAMPALFGGKWSDDLHDYSITSVRPGVVVGTGIVLGPTSSRAKLDLGVKGHLSAGWPVLESPGTEQSFHGVKRMSFGAKVLYTL